MTISKLTRHALRGLPFATVLALAATTRADVKLPTLFSDHMVLQQDAPDPIWGWAAPDEKVTVTIGDQHLSATAGADGKWMVQAAPLKAGGPLEMTVAGKNAITIKDVLIGQVWVCSGQSNMGMTVGGVKDKAKEIAEASHPQIRMFFVPNTALDEPAGDVPKGRWVVCAPETVASFSATAYFFGRDLHEAMKQPVGLINSSWGGTRIEPWISPASLENDPITKEDYAKFKAQPAVSADAAAEFTKAEAKYRSEVAKAKKDGTPAPAAPARPVGKMPNTPGYGRLYNAMINPLIPYAIHGALWYQGESNGGEGVKYRTWLPELISDWRTHWNQPGAAHDFAFLIVQLPNFSQRVETNAENVGWTLIREAEMKTADKLPNVGTAVTIDTSADGNLHPPEKQPVGHRLALIAENKVYGMKDVADSGPVVDSFTADGDKLKIKFKEIWGGLVFKGEKGVGFFIAGEDKKFYPAEATIEGDTVLLHSASVPKPVAARYAWAQNPQCNLYNKADLPAGPFRTDDWESAAPGPAKRPAK